MLFCNGFDNQMSLLGFSTKKPNISTDYIFLNFTCLKETISDHLQNNQLKQVS